ncbi:BSD domain-containing protein 1-like isoform X2 [Megalops cyprinoides]|uniref:BSD domain-containing protein 1-like isoform X2 n=1 Tax=Megalops cyprinoides TaxID=118141 RepID=UPI0018649369|nr:BSD domain-containing protein 1-like isoform X2 [Megalops cyprinoides]
MQHRGHSHRCAGQINTDKTIDCSVITLVATPSGTTELYDSVKARLYSLQADPATYCNEPDGPPEQFEAWFSTFSLEENKEEISELMTSSPSIRALYNKMVPAAVSHSEFWQRYFYKVFQVEQEEVRRVVLKERTERSADSEELDWEEEEDEFLVATFTSRLDLKSQEECSVLPSSAAADLAMVSLAKLDAGTAHGEAGLTHAGTPLVQLERPGFDRAGADEELALKLTEASLEEPDLDREGLLLETVLTGAGVARAVPEGGAGKEETELGAGGKRESLGGEGPHDLSVFELNSDSGKSSPSISGKEGSSTDVSEDWEKDFDLDMTEEEVRQTLSKLSTDGEFEDEDWENWD